MIEDIFGRSDGYVHTAEIAVHWREGNDIEKPRGDRKRVTKWISGVNGTDRPATMRFNPNKEKMVSPYSGNVISRGNCRSLADFENVLSTWASDARFARDDLEVTRADFALDCFADDDAPLFRKLCDLVIIAFCVRHGIEEKHQYWGETITTMKPKNCKAVWGQFAMERYNKGIQQSGNGAIWRMELRFIKDSKHPEREQPQTIQDMLEALADELHGLPAFYEEAQKRLNDALSAKYARLQNSSKKKLNFYQYLHQNSEKVFSRAQVKGFLRLMGVSSRNNILDKEKYFSRNYKPLYISKERFTAFVEWIISELEKWVKNYPIWTEKNTVSDGSKAE